MRGHRSLHERPVLLGLTVLVALGLGGCTGDQGEPSVADRAAIQAMLGDYLPRLATAYASGDLEGLRGLASEKEVATVYKRVSDLMTQENRVVTPALKGFEIEKVTIWNYANAFVTTLEVWDLQVLASGTDRVLSAVGDQRSRVKYQLKRLDDGSWQVMFRAIETTFE